MELILLDTRMPLAMALQTVAIMVGATPPSLIIHDGDPTITENLERFLPGIPRQRCLWHMERGLGFALWEDKLPKAARRPFQTKLQYALHTPSPETARRRYRELVGDPDRRGLRHVADFLRAAANEVFTFRTPIPGLDPALPDLVAQSPIERWMRELNRRADVGCQWKPEGLDAVVLLLVTVAIEEYNRPLLETHDAA